MQHRVRTSLWLLGLLVSLVLYACQPVAPSGSANAPSSAGTSAQTPGVTDTEVIIGTHTSLTGPAAVYAPLSKAAKAYFDYINETQGGVNGRKLVLLVEDDAYSPPKTVDLVRKLVEQDHIFALFQGLGTPTHMQVIDYLRDQGVPDLFINGSGREWIKDPAARRVSFGGIPGGVGEGAALGLYIARTYAGKKLGFLYQNDDSGKDFMDGMKRTVGAALPIAAEVSYEPTDKDLNAQVDRLKAAGVEVIGALASVRFLASAMKHARLDLNWNVPFVMTAVSANEFLFKTAGVDTVEGAVSIQYLRQAYETDNPGVAKHAELMQKYGNIDKINFITLVGQYQAELMVETLKRAGKDLTREGLIKAAESIQNFQCSVCLFPMSMSATDHDPAQSAVYVQAQGGKWVPIGDMGVSWENTLPKDISAETVKSVPSPYKK